MDFNFAEGYDIYDLLDSTITLVASEPHVLNCTTSFQLWAANVSGAGACGITLMMRVIPATTALEVRV
ncbi:MAG: hypothetical protein LBP35_01040 [Candidatus Ancillula trichonymphae]|nr:hypothetical protein [Candidatus Ancillula trichonymphae]